MLELLDRELRSSADEYSREIEIDYAVFCARYANIAPSEWHAMEDHERMAWYEGTKRLMDQEAKEQSEMLKSANTGMQDVLEKQRQTTPSDLMRRYAG